MTIIIENIILPLFDTINGGSFSKYIKRWRVYDKLSKEELSAVQRNNLDKILKFAIDNIPFYKSIQYNNDPYQLIRNFPIMKKSIVKENINSLVFGDKERLIKEASSGSSGIQGIVYLDKDAQSSHRAVQIHWWEWAGYRFGKPILQTGITPNRGFIKGLKDKILKTDYVSAYNLDTNDVLTKLKELQINPVSHFCGYASSLFVFAKIAKENNITDIKFESVVSWGDKLFPHFRQLIENQFNTRVHDTYACTEGAMIAGQCKQGAYHLMTPQTYVEIVDDDGNPVPYGTLGKVLVTRLDNFAMPLIRYYLGDLAELEDPDKTCSCGMHYPQLKRVIGRDTDIIKTASGKFMVVHAFTGIFEHIPEIKQFRVIQHNLDEIIIEYIQDLGFTQKTLEMITDKIQNYLNEKFPIIYKEVDFIPPTASGKPQLIQSFLNQSITV
jgi:phenylacetate-CoA ligase